MAKNRIILKLTTIIFLFISLALCSSQFVSSTDSDNDMNEDEEEDYVLDNPLTHLGTRSRFLASVIIKKGARCDLNTKNICNGVPAKKGTQLLFCCKNHCRNVLSDKNNCMTCGKKCKEGERCCNGVCTNVSSNVHHCGKCNKKCSHGVLCENRICGYA
ncbi:protein GRIM REAPER [Abrus precatorius]|uniref:Protein GRIM REAPER n=1 Tax=Abrus precatorius TaxID=3816 RepID=A0A8B8KGJ5_ABRPR|nr:protein GRIM REAPER [Abrus precatorius]